MTRCFRFLAAAAVTAVIASSCSGGSGRLTVTSTNLPAGLRVIGSSGCGQEVTPGDVTLQENQSGSMRKVLVHIPPSYSPRTPTPIVLNLHGSGSGPARQEAFTAMDITSDKYGFIVAYPRGGIRAGSGYDWNIPGVPLFGGANSPAGAPNDVAFLSSLVPFLSTKFCINPSMAYVTGMSGGGRMASELACDSSAVFAAAAPVAGLRLPTPCRGSRPVSVIAFHGTSDPIDPYDGHGQPYWTYSVPQAASLWGAKDKCAPHPNEVAGVGYSLTTFAECADRASVELYTVTGEGHEWPGGPILSTAITNALGPQSGAVNANSLMWAFFAAHEFRK